MFNINLRFSGFGCVGSDHQSVFFWPTAATDSTYLYTGDCVNTGNDRILVLMLMYPYFRWKTRTRFWRNWSTVSKMGYGTDSTPEYLHWLPFRDLWTVVPYHQIWADEGCPGKSAKLQKAPRMAVQSSCTPSFSNARDH